MRKVTRTVTAKSVHHKEFSDLFTRLAERHGRHQIWSDFVTMSACAISNAADKRFATERENLYLDTVKRYTKDEAEQFAAMLGVVIMALEYNPEQDFLGEVFSSLNLHNEWKGQFFTPYHVAGLMAKVNLGNLQSDLAKKEYVTVSDCCCGAGCLLIAFANEARKAHVDFQNRVIFVAQDLDYTAAMMCYIQLSLLGCKAIIKVGNSLTEPLVQGDLETDSVWYTPMYTCGSLFRLFRLANLGEEGSTDGIKEAVEAENTIEGCKGVEGKVSA